MKPITLILTLAAAVLPCRLLQAEALQFQFERFGHIAFETNPAKAEIAILTYSKEPDSEHVLFKSKLRDKGGGVFVTPGGTIFTLKHLPEAVINDGNRHINSGDWQLSVSGHGEEYRRLKPKLPKVAFGDTPTGVYFGERADQ